VRIIVRLIGFPTRETNSSHAASSQGPAQRQTTSLSDREEYRVGLGMLDILLFPVPAVNAIGVGTDGRRNRRHNLTR
jgi:hypothetical protein